MSAEQKTYYAHERYGVFRTMDLCVFGSVQERDAWVAGEPSEGNRREALTRQKAEFWYSRDVLHSRRAHYFRSIGPDGPEYLAAIEERKDRIARTLKITVELESAEEVRTARDLLAGQPMVFTDLIRDRIYGKKDLYEGRR